MISIPLAKNIPGLFGPVENLKKTMQISDRKQSASWQKFNTSDTFSQTCFTSINQFVNKKIFCPKIPKEKGTEHLPYYLNI